MRRPLLVAVALVAFVAAAPALAPATTGGTTASASAPTDAPAQPPTATDPAIVELYPNPVADGNRGEYLVVSLPVPGNWSLWDGYHAVAIPPAASGTVALATDPELARAHVDGVPVHGLDGRFPLAADGDRIELRYDGAPVDVVDYDRVREGYRWRAAWDEWRPDGYAPREPVRSADAAVEPFLLPDSPAKPISPLRRADDRILLAGYTVESTRVANALIGAADRGVTVRVLLEGTPVGGFSDRGAAVADRLVRAGVDVRVLDGDPDRFRYHHAKYAVADDTAVILTENWKASGTGGRSSRGWGVVANDSAVVAELAALYANDAEAADARPWRSFRSDTEFHPTGSATATYPTRFDPPGPTRADVELLTGPGNAADRLVDRIDAADERVLAVVPRTGGPDDRVVRALRRAADRGVAVRLLLSGAWYDYEENREVAGALADEPIDVAVAEPRGRYEKIHAKGVVADDVVVVGSLNWNERAATENREVLLAVESPAIATFYARAYAADWRGGGVHLPLGLVGGLLVAVVGAGAVARREVAFG